MALEIPACSKTYRWATLAPLVCGSAVLTVILVYPAAAHAQEKQLQEAAPPSQDQAELVDGLLDLLEEPAVEAADVEAESQQAPGQSTSEAAPSGEAGSTAAGELPPEESPSVHPLSLVHSSMRSAAEQLGRGVAGPVTQKLQSDVLRQLAELIAEIESQDPSPESQRQREASTASQSQSSETPTESPASSEERAPSDGSQPDAERQADSGSGAQDRPSQASGATAVAVDLDDPQRLQQDVWGQLPEQMRKQMQSRMVESFLPSYRPQIEAYFRKLLESQEQ